MTALVLATLLAATLDVADVRCVAAEIGCDAVATGELSATDCRADDGTLADSYPFAGTANQLVTATVRPLSSTYTNPTITLVPPPGDGSQAPVSSGGVAGSVAYRLPSSGVWNVVVGSRDPSATGAYALDLSCALGTAASDCIDQVILCGQTQSGALTREGCRFSNAQERVYQRYSIYGVAGDQVIVELRSDDFPPQINLYEPGEFFPTAVARAIPSEPGIARLAYTFTQTALHRIGATATVDGNAGRYVLRVSCATTHCVAPLILGQPEAIQVPYGQPATLAVDVHAIGPVEYAWYEFVDFPHLLGTTTVPRWETGPITGTRSYYVNARNACGGDVSKLVTVSVKTNRRRATRH